jgi:cyclopropane fatty-acyl-phospholipid synthase-like methyltransferase
MADTRHTQHMMDAAQAYEAHAEAFLRGRDASLIGSRVVEAWCRTLPAGAGVLELGCGGGYPISRVLHDAGLALWAVDSSPTLLTAFESRFPGTPVQCAKVQDSDFFGRSFDAVVAIGLIFLLPPDEQTALIHKVAKALSSRGRFLFTAPVETGQWRDLNTGIQCESLGHARYEAALAAAGFRVVSSCHDHGGNHHYDVSLTR